MPGAGVYDQVFFALAKKFQLRGIEKKDPPAKFVLRRNRFMSQVQA
jgi:hypothetical protein